MVRKYFGTWIGAVAIAFVTVACGQTDPGITTAVKSKLAGDDTVKAYTIDVDTRDKVVTLSGRVDTPAARERAVELARTTDGVRDVVDQLTVAPGAEPTSGVDDDAREAARDADAATDDAQRKAGDAADRAGDAAGDAALTTAVKTKLLGDTDVSGLKIDVDTRNGVVTLTGTVRTAAEKNKALALARETDGVKSVIDRLKVGR